MADKDSLAEKLARVGQYDDLHQYQQLKVAADMEKDATARYHEKLKRQYGPARAEAIMRQKGYNPDLLRR